MKRSKIYAEVRKVRNYTKWVTDLSMY